MIDTNYVPTQTHSNNDKLEIIYQTIIIHEELFAIY